MLIKRRLYTTIIALLALCTTTMAQTTFSGPVRYVKTNGSYANDGTSWTAAKNNLQDAIGWYMDDDDYYYEASDYEISQLLAEIMGAPVFEEVAGMTVTDSDSAITDYSEYMIFLINIAWEQTDYICGEPVAY